MNLYFGTCRKWKNEIQKRWLLKIELEEWQFKVCLIANWYNDKAIFVAFVLDPAGAGAEFFS